MNRIYVQTVLLILFIIPQAWGAKTWSTYPDPNRQTLWNNLTDSLHTMGETPRQAKLTRMKLHEERFRARYTSIQHDAQAKHNAKMKAWMEGQN
jgi:hypothetical protein